MNVQLFRQTAELGFRGEPNLPTLGSSEAAGYDVYAFLPLETQREIYPLSVEKIPTGLHIAEDPHAVVLACSRSGLASKGVQIINAPGVIDSDYRGELFMLLTYIASPNMPPFIIRHGDRIAQLLFLAPGIIQHPTITVVPSVMDLRQTNRGTGGFGSTGA
jgi:dUTP pyrophosphatase